MNDLKVDNLFSQFNVNRTAEPGKISGSYRGETVSAQTDVASMLADAAEELTFSFSETREKKIGERKKKTDLKKPAGLESAQKMADKLRDMTPRQLDKILKQIKDAGADSRKIKQLLKENFKDVTQRHLVLSYAFENLYDDPETQKAVGEIKASLEAERGPEIRAGYNIDRIDGSKVGDPDRARALYRSTVLGHPDIGQAFVDLFKRYGDDGFTHALEFLLKAIGADLSSQSPSTSKFELEQSNKDLAHVQILGNIHREMSGLLDKLAGKYGVKYE